MRVLVLGHSFVRSLSDYFSSDRSINSRKLCLEFKVDTIVSKLYLHGIRGATITEDFLFPRSLVLSIRPHIVVIELGSNDFVIKSSVENIAGSLINLAEKLVGELGVLSVVICGVIFRKELKGRSADIKELNCLIKSKLEQHHKIGFHEHAKLKKQPILKTSRDGIHPNTRLGRRLYIESISSAIHTTVRRYKLGMRYPYPQVRNYFRIILAC